MKKNNLAVWIGLFWLVSGAFSVQMSWFVISLALEDVELWHFVIERTNKDPLMNIMIAFTLTVIGFFQMIYGTLQIAHRDNKIDKHDKPKDMTKSKYLPEEPE